MGYQHFLDFIVDTETGGGIRAGSLGWFEYQNWTAAGNVPAPAERPPRTISVTPWQMREALNRSGLRAAVESAVAVASQAVQDGWEFAQEFRSDNALIAAVAQSLGKTDADALALFALAKSLTL